MMARSFYADLQRIANKRKEEVLRIVQGSFIEVGSRIIQRSPVDTGRFRSNWHGGWFEINAATDETTDPTGQYALGRLTTELRDYAMGDVYYFTNSLAYAQRLEWGWSAKSPAGMVRISVAEFRNIVRENSGR